MFRPFLQLPVRHGPGALAVIGLILFLSASVFAYSDGNGTEGNPYQITVVSDWQQLMSTSSHWNKYFIMTADVNLQGVTLTPVGNATTKFTGVFDGNDYVIRNAYINSPTTNYIGLFGYTSSGCQIRNLILEDAAITARRYVGGLVGYNYFGNLTDCYVTGAVTGTGSSLWVGGLVGYNDRGSITYCRAGSSVTASGDYVGGLAGYNNYGSLTACFATGPVTGTTNYVGGLAGNNGTAGTITACYAIGAVTGASSIGGLAGINTNTITDCYAAGMVTATGSAGGLVGSNSGGSVSSSFWDIDTSGRLTSAGGEGKTTDQMKNTDTFLSADWDFNTPVWKMCNGINYPKLAWQVIAGDFVEPEGVDYYDLAFLTDRWLLEKLSYDVAPSGGDGIINFLDWAIFINDWQGNIDQLLAFTSQWLGQGGDCCADIAPEPKGDGIVNMLDFAALADNWLKET
jgi:hypothetical protein